MEEGGRNDKEGVAAKEVVAYSEVQVEVGIAIMKCSQCDRAAVNLGLCVDHFFTYVQGILVQRNMAATQFNMLAGQLEAGSGGISRMARMPILPTPGVGDKVVFNNIHVDGSTIGSLNLGYIEHLETAVSVMKEQGEESLARAIGDLTKATIESREVEDETKDKINELLEFLAAQVMTEPEGRSLTIVEGVLVKLQGLVVTATGLVGLWEKLEPLVKQALGVS
ncbi:MAG: hypothetical protein ACUZ8A_04500 [Candidatus Bathyanammoxibius sp.]